MERGLYDKKNLNGEGWKNKHSAFNLPVDDSIVLALPPSLSRVRSRRGRACCLRVWGNKTGYWDPRVKHFWLTVLLPTPKSLDPPLWQKNFQDGKSRQGQVHRDTVHDFAFLFFFSSKKRASALPYTTVLGSSSCQTRRPCHCFRVDEAIKIAPAASFRVVVVVI
jgi:hypothetical protein